MVSTVTIAADLAAVGSPVSRDDLAACRAQRMTPLHLAHSAGDLYNMTPPTQGVVSLAILGLLERAGLCNVAADSADHVHLVVEATKRAFTLRDRYVTDPRDMAIDGQPLQSAVSAPRWLLGRTWGQQSDTLKLEQRFPQEVVDELARRGHDVEVLLPFDETMGHAGAIVRHADGTLEGASDPRSDGGVAAW